MSSPPRCIDSVAALTLRAAAREAGIAAPSIYGHFADRGQILQAVVAQVFGELQDVVRTAADVKGDPAARLKRVCRAYLDFAERRPADYRVLFGRSPGPATQLPREMSDLAGAGAFGVLDESVAAVARTGDDVLAAATALWVALHGYATLRASGPVFPWPDGLVALLVDRLAGPAR
jgi:AcrR family transcriptional regulator